MCSGENLPKYWMVEKSNYSLRLFHNQFSTDYISFFRSSIVNEIIFTTLYLRYSLLRSNIKCQTTINLLFYMTSFSLLLIFGFWSTEAEVYIPFMYITLTGNGRLHPTITWTIRFLAAALAYLLKHSISKYSTKKNETLYQVVCTRV